MVDARSPAAMPPVESLDSYRSVVSVLSGTLGFILAVYLVRQAQDTGNALLTAMIMAMATGFAFLSGMYLPCQWCDTAHVAGPSPG